MDIFTADELDAFLAQRDSLNLGHNKRFTFWAALLAEKFMKLLASEYSCLTLDSPDTSTVTLTVASLMQHKRFSRHLLSCLLRSAGVAMPEDGVTGLGARRVFCTVLAMVIVYKGLRTAACVVLPLFHELSHVRMGYVTEARAALRAAHHTLFEHQTPAVCWDIVVDTLRELHACLVDAAVLTTEVRMMVAIAATFGNEGPDEVAYHMMQWKLLTLKTTHTIAVDSLPPVEEGSVYTSITAGQLWECRECFSTIRVTQRARSSETGEDTEAEVHNVTCAGYFQLLINLMHKYIAQQQAEREAATNNTAGPATDGSQGKAANNGAITAREVANRLGEVLRFESPFDELLRESGVWHDVLHSEGWVPMTVIEACLEHWARLRSKLVVPNLSELLEEILLRHNMSGRYQVDVCALKQSRFEQQRCARALYGHRITTVPLYHRILCHPARRLAGEGAAREVPVCAWMQIDLKTLRTRPADLLLRVFAQRPMYVLLPAKTIGMFGSYHDAYSVEQRFDVKLNHSAPLFFVEVYLRALIRDEEHICVYARPSSKHGCGASDATQWFVFSSYTQPTETRVTFTEATRQLAQPEAVQVDCGGLPKVFLTGRVVRLENGGCGTEETLDQVTSEFGTFAARPVDSGLVLHSCTIALNKLPDSVLPPHVRQDGLHADAAASPALRQVFPPELVATLFADAPDHSHADAADGVVAIKIQRGAASVPRYLDVRALHKQVEEFCVDTTRDVARLEVPLRAEDGTNFSDRQRHVEELKAFLTRRGLMYKLISCPTPAMEERSEDTEGDGSEGTEGAATVTAQVYEIRRRPAWGEATLREVAASLGLDEEMECHLPLLRASLTRECENKTDNYELLEFIGDALMDFIVMLDTCILDVMRTTQDTRSTSPPPPPSHGAEGDSGRDTAAPQARVPDMQLRLDVVSKVCNNKVLAQLLPPVVRQHFTVSYGVDVHYKVLADVFEAMLGAVYRAELGLGTVRRVLRRLFAELPARLSAEHAAPDADYEVCNHLHQACKTCPYVYDTEGMIERLLPMTDTYVIDAVLQARYGLHSFSVTQMLPGNHSVETGGAAAAAVGSSHESVTFFPRIQVKQYATHFTSGWAFSFRRLPALDTPRVFNRLLAFSQQGLPTYMNEIITETTQFVVDFDGANIRSWGVMHLLWRWACRTFGRPLPMLLLDCSGLSVLKETKYKHSCHIHFAQATMDLPTLQRLQTSLRDYIKHHVTTQTSWHCLPEDEVTQMPRSGGGAASGGVIVSDTAAGDASRATVRPGCAVLCTASYVARQLGKLPTWTTWITVGRRHVWVYCNFDDLLQLSHTCHLWRRSVFEHVAECMLTVRTLASIFGITSENAEDGGGIVLQGEEGDNVAMAVVELAGRGAESRAAVAPVGAGAVEHVAPRCVLLPQSWLPHLCARSGAANAAMAGGGTSVRQSPDWASVVDAGLIASRKLRMFTCDKWDQIYGKANRPLHLDTLCLPMPPRYAHPWCRTASPPADQPQQTESHTNLAWQELRVERTDRSYYADEAQMRHRQRAATVARLRERCQWPATVSTEPDRASSLRTEAEQPTARTADEGGTSTGDAMPSTAASPSVSDALWNFDEERDYPVEVARASTLQLTSLRCPQYRDVWGMRHDAWDAMCAADETGTDDLLPRFDAVMAASRPGAAARIGDACPTRISCRSWRVWLNCLHCATPSEMTVTDKTLAPALLPTWWTYTPATHVATFYVAGEPALRIKGCASLGEALHYGSNGYGGMRCLAYYLIPHLDYSKTEALSTTCAIFPPDIVPTYLLPGLQRAA